MLLVVDNGSIYTKNLIDFLNEKNIFFEKQIPQLLDLNSLEKYDSIILSGRRKNEKKINEINSKIISYSIRNNIKWFFKQTKNENRWDFSYYSRTKNLRASKSIRNHEYGVK